MWKIRDADADARLQIRGYKRTSPNHFISLGACLLYLNEAITPKFSKVFNISATSPLEPENMASFASSSVFSEELQPDLSWIWNFTEEENDNTIMKLCPSSNSSPDRNSSSGLGSIPSNSSPTLALPPLINGATSGIVLSQSVGHRQEPVPLWSHPGVVGYPRYCQSIPGGISYVLKPAYQPLMTNEVAYFFLLPSTTLHNQTNHNNVQKKNLNICARIVHSNGYSSFVEMQKFDKVPGYQCSFVPYFSGKYSANVFLEGGAGSLNFDSSTINLCSPLELEVSRNYGVEARNPSTPAVTLNPNGDKYWGISGDKFTDKLYVTDRYSSEVIVLDPEIGEPFFRFGQSNSLRFSSKQLYRPAGIVIDERNRRLLICDKDHHRICIFTLDGSFISSFGKLGHHQSEFNYPWDIDVSPNGDMIAVSDSRNHRVQFFDRFGNYLKKFTVFESDPFEYKKYFDYPRGIAFSNDGKTLFVTDFNNHNVVSLVVETLEHKMLAPTGKLNRPQGVVVDEVGNILVCDTRNNCIRSMTSTGDLIISVSNVGQNAIHTPVDSCILRGGKVATLEINGRIHFY